MSKGEAKLSGLIWKKEGMISEMHGGGKADPSMF